LHVGSVFAAGALVDGTWISLPSNAATTITADAPYSVTSICRHGNQAEPEEIWTELFAPYTGGEHWLHCPPSDPVTIIIDEPDDDTLVFVGDAVSVVGDAVVVQRGVYDAFAYTSADNVFEVIRDFDATVGPTLTVDFAGAQSLEPRDVIVDGAPFEPGPKQVYAQLRLANEFSTTALIGDAVTPLFVPRTALADDDIQEVVIREMVDASRYRETRTRVTDTPISVTSAPTVESATATFVDGVPTFTWEYPLEATSVRARAIGTGETIYAWYVEAHEGALDALGTTTSMEGVDPRQVPGWEPAWVLPPDFTLIDVIHERDDGADVGFYYF
jgi:hypothetical protein